MRKLGSAHATAAVNRDGSAVATVYLYSASAAYKGSARLDYESADRLHYELGQLLADETIRRLREAADDLEVFNGAC